MNDEPATSGDSLILSRDEVRAIDQAAVEELGIPGLLLMENAARGLVSRLHRVSGDGRLVILCGPGNNGGDGLAAARLLAAEGRTVQVMLITAGRSLSSDAQSNLSFLINSGMEVEVCEDAVRCRTLMESLSSEDWIVESLLGTGVRGGLRSPYVECVQAINVSAARVLAVDVPTGLDCDTGTWTGECVRADQTVTFAGLKRGFQQPGAAEVTGEVTVAHIGIPQVWVRRWLQRLRTESSGPPQNEG